MSLLMVFLMIGLCAYAAVRVVTGVTVPVLVTLLGFVRTIHLIRWRDRSR